MTHLRLVHSADRQSHVTPPLLLSAHHADQVQAQEPLFLTLRLADGSELIMREAGAGWDVIGQARATQAKPDPANRSHGARFLAEMILLSDIAAAYGGAPRRQRKLAVVSSVQA